MRKRATWLGALALVLLGTGAFAEDESEKPLPAQERRGISPEADQWLHRMSDYLGKLPAFTAVADSSTEVVLKSGQKVEFDASSQLAVRRPDRLRSDRVGELAKLSFFYDGRNLTLYGREKNLYATEAAPPTLDETIDFAAQTLGLDVPGSDLLLSNPYAALTEDAVSGEYIGKTTVDGVPCHHLAFRGHETDWQIWIEDGPRPLPRKYVITSKTEPQSPEFVVVLHDWNVEPQLEDSLFDFQPPPGADRIEFRSAVSGAQGKAGTKGGGR